MSINLQEIGRLFRTKVNAAITDTSLRLENSELREKWKRILETCCNAEAEVEHLQDQVETLDLKLADADEAYHRQVAEYFRLSTELSSIKIVNTKEKADRQLLYARLAELERKVADYDYVVNYSKEQSNLINQTSAVVESLHSQIAVLKAKEVNSEHLAKQVVKLQEELSKLKMTYCSYQKNKNGLDLPCGTCVKCKLDAAYGIIERSTENVKRLESENWALKQKITNQFECVGSRTGEVGLMCGGCGTCLLKQSQHILDQTAENLVHRNQELTNLKDSYDTQGKMVGSLLDEKKHLNQLIENLVKGIRSAFLTNIFGRKKVILKTLGDASNFSVKYNIVWKI